MELLCPINNKRERRHFSTAGKGVLALLRMERMGLLSLLLMHRISQMGVLWLVTARNGSAQAVNNEANGIAHENAAKGNAHFSPWGCSP
jgi:hypothetical protein